MTILLHRLSSRVMMIIGVFCVGFSSLSQAETLSVKVGCLFPLSGPSAIYGEDSVAAIAIAQDELRQQYQWSQKKGGSSRESYPLVDVFFADTKSKPLRAIQLARQFVDKDEVSFLCGAVSSSVALAVTQVAKNKRTIFIGTDHASPRLVDEAWHPYYFRMNNGTRQSMAAGAKYIAQHYQHKNKTPLRIAFIGPDYDYGYRAWDDLRYFLSQQGVDFTIAAELWPSLNQKKIFLIY